MTAYLHLKNQVAHAVCSRGSRLASLSIHFPIHFARRAHEYPVILSAGQPIRMPDSMEALLLLSLIPRPSPPPAVFDNTPYAKSSWQALASNEPGPGNEAREGLGDLVTCSTNTACGSGRRSLGMGQWKMWIIPSD